jgi:hypothetical protein
MICMAQIMSFILGCVLKFVIIRLKSQGDPF